MKCIACLGVFAATLLSYGQGIIVNVDNERVDFPAAQPQMVGSRVLVPLRGVFERLGAHVHWDSASKTVEATRDSAVVRLRIGDRTATVNGREVTLDVPARIIQSSTMVPLRFVSEAMGAKVDWVARTETVNITTAADSGSGSPPNRGFPLNGSSTGVWAALPFQTPGENYGADFYERTRGMSFGIRTIRYTSATDLNVLAKGLNQVNSEIAQAEKVQKYAILELNFWDGNERSRATPPAQDVSEYAKRLQWILDRTHWDSPAVVGVSLSEENVPTNNGRAAILDGLYGYLHDHFPGIFVFQWYTPNTCLPIPYEGVDVRADGWIIDTYTLCSELYPDSKYHMSGDPYTWLLQKYLATGKPVVDVIYASNYRSYMYSPGNPQNKAHFDMRQIMEHQFEVNQRYNVPTGFYWTSWSDSKRSDTPTFDRSQVGDALLNEISGIVLDMVKRARGG